MNRLESLEQMVLEPQRIGTRGRFILAGLYLAKYDKLGLKMLGFDSFAEAFNVIGFALGGKPASIKNYRDEFDPLFPNRRKGWHKRPTRDYCLKLFKEYNALDLAAFTALVKSFVGFDENALSELESIQPKADSALVFANRVMTGLAAEHYFEAVYARVPEFKGYDLENTTRLGCGYDFRLKGGTEKDFLAVEVKGLKERSGSLSLTPKEHEMAGTLTNQFFLFAVKNFQEKPFHEIYQNPRGGQLRFARKERVAIHVSWQASV